MSAASVSISPAARADLDDTILWLRAEADGETAARFAVAADTTFNKLAQSPRIAPAAGSRQVRLKTIRKWKVAGFPKMLIFFDPLADGIEIIRILHAAADWWAILDVE